MTVPLDRLYNFLDDLVDQDIVIYRSYPHGSKLLKDIKLLNAHSLFEQCTNPIVFCHDQEPLNYYLYSEDELVDACMALRSAYLPYSREEFIKVNNVLKMTENYVQEIIRNPINLYNKYILLNSEKNSVAVDDYINHGAIPVYYFCHALIARDWFRFAEIDPMLSRKNIKKDFLVYQRSWSGSREYRLKFSELLIDAGLQKNCKSAFAPYDDSNVYYLDHLFKNINFRLQRKDLEYEFSFNHTPSWYSADYIANDYCETRFEVVLETLFDDQRWHLTEKIFRPIACKQPFILASTPGSLKYLKSYGFKTFGDYIDESYDDIADPIQRLGAIINTMQSISSLSVEQKEELHRCLQPIVDYNKNWFFSKEFFNNIVGEYQTNLLCGLESLKQYRGDCLKRWHLIKKNNAVKNILTEEEYQELLRRI